jgi:AcrR family transcriptional regulator
VILTSKKIVRSLSYGPGMEFKFNMQESQHVGRKASRAFRREQLIEAVIATLANRGISQTTLSEVAKAAGVSHGLINFHFQSKDALLAETLSFMSNEHRSIWTAALAGAGPSPANRLNALVLAEFDQVNLSRERLTAWFVFWGEALKGSAYDDQCGENDRAQVVAFEEACRGLAEQGGYDFDVTQAARVLRLTIFGVKQELTLAAVPITLEDALKTVYFTAAMLFPRHFGKDGLVSR